MQTVLRDLKTLDGIDAGAIVRGADVVASTFGDERSGAMAATGKILGRLAGGFEGAGSRLGELQVEFDEKRLLVVPVGDDAALAVLVDRDADLTFVSMALQSSARQLRTMMDLPPPPPREVKARPKPAAAAPPKAEAEAPRAAAAQAESDDSRRGSRRDKKKRKQQGKPAPKPATKAPEKAAPAKPAAPPKPKPPASAEPLLPKVLDLLTEAIGPVARITYKQGVDAWKKDNKATVDNLGKLAEILSADLGSDAEKKAFVEAVEKLAND